MRKMSQKMNVLSSKYTIFDDESDNHLAVFNCQDSENIKATNKINSAHASSEPKKSYKINSFCFENSAANSFIGQYNIYSHSQSLKVRNDFAEIYDENKFMTETKKQFERRTGKGSISNVTILHCESNGELIHQIVINIKFHTSLSYCYLNNVKFPTNWIFFERDKFKTRVKYPAKSQRMPFKKQHTHNKH